MHNTDGGLLDVFLVAFDVSTALLGVVVVILYIALTWICYNLRNDKEVMGNEKLMAFHSTIQLLILGGSVTLRLFF
jgi:hypothetical protein